jgi:hypothetical protein
MDTLEEVALRSRRVGWLSLFGAVVVFLSIGYSYFTIRQLDYKVAQRSSEITSLQSEILQLEGAIKDKKNHIQELNSSIITLRETRNSAAALLLDILNIEHQVRVDKVVNWEGLREQLLSMPSGQRQEAVLTAILLAWKDVPFNIDGNRFFEGLSSPGFIKYVLSLVGIKVQEKSGERISDALMRSFEKTEHTDPGDIACYKGAIGSFCLLIISTDSNGKPLAAIGTLETVNPLGIYAMSNINIDHFPLVGYFKVSYKS